jgi:2C-methyl-D-erythritol 2,4-cyclodiphosphate synthase
MTSNAKLGGASDTASFATSRVASFTQQTQSMNELDAVLADSTDRLQRHRRVITDRIAALEKDNQQIASKFQDGLKNPEQLLTVGRDGSVSAFWSAQHVGW